MPVEQCNAWRDHRNTDAEDAPGPCGRRLLVRLRNVATPYTPTAARMRATAKTLTSTEITRGRAIVLDNVVERADVDGRFGSSRARRWSPGERKWIWRVCTKNVTSPTLRLGHEDRLPDGPSRLDRMSPTTPSAGRTPSAATMSPTASGPRRSAGVGIRTRWSAPPSRCSRVCIRRAATKLAGAIRCMVPPRFASHGDDAIGVTVWRLQHHGARR
jgi:hypothetical protein